MDVRISGMPDGRNVSDGGILTMAFVNFQPLDEVYTLCEGFSRGTIFPNIDKPFKAGGMKR